MDQQAVFLTFRLAFFTTLILMAIAVPLGYWLAYGKARWMPVIEACVALPLVLPPTVLGFYLLVVMGPRNAAGRLLSLLFGHTLAFSFSGLLIGSIIFSLPFAVQPVASGFRSLDREILEAAALLSSSRRKILMRVLLPLVRSSLLTAAVLAFTHTVGEFGVVLMIGGGIPGVTKTLSISIYDQVQDFAYAQANHTALLLLGVSFLALLLIYGRRGSVGV
ncbi:MAG TPA: molybdate ABC transporter permease subunit [Acidobacteriaceae bacterium]|nr:molybdate ABC transporter permease subunit [Acidobacteriaceae bacterium]